MQGNSLYNKELHPKSPCSNISTSVESSLQINLFMQNEHKFQKPQMAIKSCKQRTYNNFCSLETPKNEPKRTQNEPKRQNTKAKLTHCPEMTYMNFCPFELFKNEPKTNPNEPKTNPTRQLRKDPSLSPKNPPKNAKYTHHGVRPHPNVQKNAYTGRYILRLFKGIRPNIIDTKVIIGLY